MKKLVSLALALILVLSMGLVAFADGTEVTYAPSTPTSFEEIIKIYTSENNVQFSESLNFVSTPDGTNPDNTNLTVDTLVVGDDAFTTEGQKIKVNVPSYSQAGVYYYTIEEADGNTAGVTYTTNEIRVVVMVEYDNENNQLKIGNVQYFIVKENGEKTDTYENLFKSGSFSVAKDVTGNMANENDEFEITVTLTAPAGKVIRTPIKVGGVTVNPDQWVHGKYETTRSLSEADGAITFADIPEGVTVTVTENTAADKMNGYTLKGITDDGSLTVADDTNAAIVVTNEKKTTIETGVSMDSMPYILLLAAAGMGLLMLIGKKRMARD